MVDCIVPQKDVLDLYRKHKSDFNFHQRTDDEFLIFLLNAAARVVSIAQQLTPVIEAVSIDADTSLVEESKENILSDPVSPEPSQAEPLACQEEAISQLARELESAAETLSSDILPSINDESKDDVEMVQVKSETENEENSILSNIINEQSSDYQDSHCPIGPSALSSYSMLESALSNVGPSQILESTITELQEQQLERSLLSSKPNESANEDSISQIDPNGNDHKLVKTKQRRCKVCHKVRRRSCSICDVGLCQTECFLSFHKDFMKYSLYVEQYKSFGKNHRSRMNYHSIPYRLETRMERFGKRNHNDDLDTSSFDYDNNSESIQYSSQDLSMSSEYPHLT